MNRHLGEREREATFLTYLCFAGYEKELTWPLFARFGTLSVFILRIPGISSPRLSCHPVSCPPILDRSLRLVLSPFLVVEQKTEEKKKLADL